MKANKSTKVKKIRGIACQLNVGDYFHLAERCFVCLYKIIPGDSYNQVGIIRNIKHCGRCKSIPYDPLKDPVIIFRG